MVALTVCGSILSYLVVGYVFAKWSFRDTYKHHPTIDEWSAIRGPCPMFWDILERRLFAACSGVAWPVFMIGRGLWRIGKPLFTGWVPEPEDAFSRHHDENEGKRDWISG